MIRTATQLLHLPFFDLKHVMLTSYFTCYFCSLLFSLSVFNLQDSTQSRSEAELFQYSRLHIILLAEMCAISLHYSSRPGMYYSSNSLIS